MTTMTTIPGLIRRHLSESGMSMRALSLEAGLHPKAVSEILSGKVSRPRVEALEKLSRATGLDLAAIAPAPVPTVADRIRMLRTEPPAGWSRSRIGGAVAALRVYARATAVSPDVALIDRQRVRAWLSTTTGAALGLADESLRAYASHLRAVLDADDSAERPRQIRDVQGSWRELHAAVAALDLPQDLKWVGGGLFAYCDAAGLTPEGVSSGTFAAYLAHRLASGTVTQDEATQQKAVRRCLALWNRLAETPALAARGVRPVESPFADGRDKYGMPMDLLAPLLAEVDGRLMPWVRGEATPEGRSIDEVLTELYPVETTAADPKKAAVRAFVGRKSRARQNGRDDRLREAGVLLSGAIWGDARCMTMRAGIIALAKALWAASTVVIESLQELTDPEILESAAIALDEANDDDGVGSDYVSHLLKAVLKIARGYTHRSEPEIESISEMISDFTPDRVGIAPRNRRKLEQLTPERITRFLRMSDDLVAEANAAIARRRRNARRAGAAPEAPVEVAVARTLEIAVAHEILCARPLRPGNLLAIDVARHLRQDPDGRLVIELPPEIVKNKVPLVIPLNAERSELVLKYVGQVRNALLSPDNQSNTLLFPARLKSEGHYSHLLQRLMDEIHRRVGVRIHPHLYRHIVGWIWLKEDPSRLPSVQKLLGHKKLETTMKFYAELDETLALQQWQDYLERRRNDVPADAA